MLKFPDKVDSKFRFVLVAAARAEQMMRGARPKVEPGQNKPGRVAMQEIREGAVDWGYGPAPERVADGGEGAAEEPES